MVVGGVGMGIGGGLDEVWEEIRPYLISHNLSVEQTLEGNPFHHEYFDLKDIVKRSSK
jgi:hypothetical protein